MLVDAVPQGPEQEEAIEALTHYLVPRTEDPWRVRVRLSLPATDSSEPGPDVAVAQPLGRDEPRTAALVIEVTVSTHRLDPVHEPAVHAAADVDQHRVVDVPAREVVVHRGPGPGGCADVQRLPWTAPLSVLGVPVDLAALLPG